MKRLTVAVMTALVLATFSIAQAKEGHKAAAGTSQTFKVGADCKIATADNKNAAIADLKVGDKVHIAYSDAGGTLTAAKIHVATEKPAGDKKPEHKGDKKEGEHKKDKPADDLKHAHGIITAIDAAAGTVTVEDKGEHHKK
jgi:hypothetical protein